MALFHNSQSKLDNIYKTIPVINTVPIYKLLYSVYPALKFLSYCTLDQKSYTT